MMQKEDMPVEETTWESKAYFYLFSYLFACGLLSDDISSNDNDFDRIWKKAAMVRTQLRTGDLPNTKHNAKLSTAMFGVTGRIKVRRMTLDEDE
jgi:hypothetical protein